MKNHKKNYYFILLGLFLQPICPKLVPKVPPSTYRKKEKGMHSRKEDPKRKNEAPKEKPKKISSSTLGVGIGTSLVSAFGFYKIYGYFKKGETAITENVDINLTTRDSTTAITKRPRNRTASFSKTFSKRESTQSTKKGTSAGKNMSNVTENTSKIEGLKLTIPTILEETKIKKSEYNEGKKKTSETTDINEKRETTPMLSTLRISSENSFSKSEDTITPFSDERHGSLSPISNLYQAANENNALRKGEIPIFKVDKQGRGGSLSEIQDDKPTSLSSKKNDVKGEMSPFPAVLELGYENDSNTTEESLSSSRNHNHIKFNFDNSNTQLETTPEETPLAKKNLGQFLMTPEKRNKVFNPLVKTDGESSCSSKEDSKSPKSPPIKKKRKTIPIQKKAKINQKIIEVNKQNELEITQKIAAIKKKKVVRDHAKRASLYQEYHDILSQTNSLDHIWKLWQVPNDLPQKPIGYTKLGKKKYRNHVHGCLTPTQKNNFEQINKTNFEEEVGSLVSIAIQSAENYGSVKKNVIIGGIEMNLGYIYKRNFPKMLAELGITINFQEAYQAPSYKFAISILLAEMALVMQKHTIKENLIPDLENEIKKRKEAQKNNLTQEERKDLDGVVLKIQEDTTKVLKAHITLQCQQLKKFAKLAQNKKLEEAIADYKKQLGGLKAPKLGLFAKSQKKKEHEEKKKKYEAQKKYLELLIQWAGLRLGKLPSFMKEENGEFTADHTALLYYIRYGKEA